MPWSDLFGATGDLDPNAGVLVVVTLYGGNDDLGTVIPAVDAAYHDARPELSYQPSEVHDLGEGLGLNPALRGLKGHWDAGRLAVVRGVGYPQPDHSHFRSMAIWQTGSPTSPNGAGWLGRWLDTVPTTRCAPSRWNRCSRRSWSSSTPSRPPSTAAGSTCPAGRSGTRYAGSVPPTATTAPGRPGWPPR